MFTEHHLYFEDVEVDQEWVSPGRTVTQADIINFAGISGDYNAIHVDHEFAKNTPYRQPIAHGLLVMAMSSGLGLYHPAMRTRALMSVLEWHFKAPVFIGDTIHARTKVLAKEQRGRGRRGVITWQRQILNQAGKVVQEGKSQTLVEGRPATGDEAKDDDGSEP